MCDVPGNTYCTYASFPQRLCVPVCLQMSPLHLVPACLGRAFCRSHTAPLQLIVCARRDETCRPDVPTHDICGAWLFVAWQMLGGAPSEC